MAKLRYIYVPVTSLSPELQEIAYRFRQVEDGFVIIHNKWAAWPKSADAIFDEKHRRYDATHFPWFHYCARTESVPGEGERYLSGCGQYVSKKEVTLDGSRVTCEQCRKKMEGKR